MRSQLRHSVSFESASYSSAAAGASSFRACGSCCSSCSVSFFSTAASMVRPSTAIWSAGCSRFGQNSRAGRRVARTGGEERGRCQGECKVLGLFSLFLLGLPREAASWIKFFGGPSQDEVPSKSSLGLLKKSKSSLGRMMSSQHSQNEK